MFLIKFGDWRHNLDINCICLRQLFATLQLYNNLELSYSRVILFVFILSIDFNEIIEISCVFISIFL